MPRKTKDIEKNEEKEVKAKTNKKSTAKATEKKASVSSKKVTQSKKEKDKKTTVKSKKENPKKATTKTTKKVDNTKNKSDKKSTTSKAKTTKAKKSDKTTEKKVTTKKSTTTTRKTAKKEKVIVEPVEYYDLPYGYNQTVVKLLAQTPNNLFVYWDISNEDRENYKKLYGENFFEQTKPVLIVHNETLNYSFEVDINDFANSWYLHINDSKCDYKIELGRRPIVFDQEINTKIHNNYVYISSSNDIESPNDKILFNINPESIQFRNVKTQSTNNKAISRISFMPQLNQMAKIYNLYDLYKNLYKDENLQEVFNPSSGNPSSDSFTSRFM